MLPSKAELPECSGAESILHSVSSLVQICLKSKLIRTVVQVLVRSCVDDRAGAELLPQSQQQPIFLDRPCQVNKLCETHRFCSLRFGHPGAVSDMLCVRKSDLLGTNLWRFI